MTYRLSLSGFQDAVEHFHTVVEALDFYESLQEREREGGAPGAGRAELHCLQRNTFVVLLPGISVQTVTEELETVWEWAPEDRLKIRPMLKERYRTKT
ncbi:MAG: hypothetical protein DI621_06675 [Pseudomonas protegens]|nr:MAG: hypothetical protein DI621_06675 [Pseudomonas protegens]SEQ66125.1 hypothetical protein SAMN03159354_01948 [Pseudomonas sp. NFPP19]